MNVSWVLTAYADEQAVTAAVALFFSPVVEEVAAEAVELIQSPFRRYLLPLLLVPLAGGCRRRHHHQRELRAAAPGQR